MTTHSDPLSGGPRLPRRSHLPSLRATLERALHPARLGIAPTPELLASLRRLARAVSEDEAALSRPELAARAAAVLSASDEQVLEAATTLLALLRATDSGPDGDLILVVEDDPVSARAIAAALRAPGRQIEIAGSAAAARAAIDREVPSLLVLDLILPDGDGRSLLLELRSRPRTAALPVLVLTARLGGATRDECFALGADGYFEKPVDLPGFAVAVSSRLERHAQLVQLCRRDLVTGLPNRAAFLESWQALEEGLPTGTPCAIAVIDLDHFRWVSDRWGRHFGDAVLRRAGVRIAMAVRGASCFARWEGAEFIALFRGKTAAEAAVQVEHALQVLRRVDFRAGEPEPLLLTFSAGVSDLLVGGNFDDAMASADRLRDAAKHAGRNRVISALPDDGLPKRRILLAEDDPDVVRILTRHLQREGFEVLHCANGRLALETAPMAGVAAIISDIEMPELNGLGFLEGVRAHPMLKHVPMMMLTAVGAEDVIVRAFELGADDYVTKPFVVREVVARVRRLLRRPSVSAVALALEA